MVPRRATQANQPILVAYDDSPGARRALEIAAKLTPAAEDRLSIVIVAESRDEGQTTRSACRTRMRQHGLPASSCADYTASGSDQLVQAAATSHARLLMVASDNPPLENHGLDELLEGLECPLAMVR